MENIDETNIISLSDDELDRILDATEYAERGVAVGGNAAEDQDLRRLAQAEIERRSGKSNW